MIVKLKFHYEGALDMIPDDNIRRRKWTAMVEASVCVNGIVAACYRDDENACQKYAQMQTVLWVYPDLIVQKN